MSRWVYNLAQWFGEFSSYYLLRTTLVGSFLALSTKGSCTVVIYGAGAENETISLLEEE